jgi:pyrroline-5-carboxylate reductase
MGFALLQGWLELGLEPKDAVVIEPQPSDYINELSTRGLRLNPAPTTRIDPAALVIAVKPQVAPEAVPNLRPHLASKPVVVSIMAGRTISFLEGLLGHSTAIVRAMPNTPAAIGRGITVAVPNASVPAKQRVLVDSLLATTGAVEWIGDEALMDAVTAVSGSGPAFVFLLAEALADAGEAAGLPPDLAAHLADATVAGAGELLHRSGLDPATLRENVTSPGGTTAAALAVLMAADGLAPLLEKAVAAAKGRSRDLAS